MKTEIHPKNNNVVFVDTSSGVEFATTSTRSSEKTKTIDGVEHFVIDIEISSASHPFYTGKQVFIDTARRVEKFQEKMAKKDATADARKGKRVKHAVRAAKEAAKIEATPENAK